MSEPHQELKKLSDRPPSPADRLFNALTQSEINQLINALFSVLSPELKEEAIAQLSDDTQQTIQKILAPTPIQSTQESDTEIVSLAKQAQTWSELWRDWNAIVWEASEENGKYLEQEHDWEQPYFDTYTFVADLEKVAAQMYPLLSLAFEEVFSPDDGFATALLEVEAGVLEGLEDWMELPEGLHLEHYLTSCLLQWEWLMTQYQEKTAYQFAQRIRECELQFQEIELAPHTTLTFFLELPEADQRCILEGFTANRESSLWQKALRNNRSYWHRFYLHLVEHYVSNESPAMQ